MPKSKRIYLTIAKPLRKIWAPIVILFTLSASAMGTELIIGSSIGRCSSLSYSGPAIPMAIESGFDSEAEIVRQDATVYGINMSVDRLFGFCPTLGFYFLQQQVIEKNGSARGSAGNFSCIKSHMSLDVSSTTTFVWSSLGVEMNFPRKSKDARSAWRSLIIGAGGSLIYAKDRIHPGSRYVEHYERWSHDPIFFSEPELVEFRHEEKDFGGSSSSGLGVGWYLLSGFKFYLSRHISLTFEIRADFGTLRLKPEEGSITNNVGLYIGTISCRLGIRR